MPPVLSDIKVLMCSLKTLVVMSIIIPLYQLLVILCYCWSNIWKPKFKVCLWITEDSCQNWQLKYHNFINCASACSRCQDWRKHRRRGRNAAARVALWGPVDLLNISYWGCGAQCWLTGSRFGFLHCFEKPCTNTQLSMEQKMKIADLHYLLNRLRERKK